jgi:hypothetical protein
MGKPTGFIEIQRKKQPTRPVEERVQDWREIYLPYPTGELEMQGARCMDCGIPFCHQGCPLGNLIPDWNDLVYRDHWHAAIERLHATNNFPEFTGKLCPAPCEGSCVLGINDYPVTIKSIEAAIIDRAWDDGWVVARAPVTRTIRADHPTLRNASSCLPARRAAGTEPVGRAVRAHRVHHRDARARVTPVRDLHVRQWRRGAARGAPDACMVARALCAHGLRAERPGLHGGGE